MIFNQNCNNLNIKYYEELIEIDIEFIKNNVERFKIYEYVLEIFKLNKVNMIIKYCDKEFLVYNESRFKKYFQKFIIISTYPDSDFLSLKTVLSTLYKHEIRIIFKL